MENQKPIRRARGFTLPALFLLSLAVNYGQFSGWIRIENPVAQEAKVQAIYAQGFNQGQASKVLQAKASATDAIALSLDQVE